MLLPICACDLFWMKSPSLSQGRGLWIVAHASFKAVFFTHEFWCLQFVSCRSTTALQPTFSCCTEIWHAWNALLGSLCKHPVKLANRPNMSSKGVKFVEMWGAMLWIKAAYRISSFQSLNSLFMKHLLYSISPPPVENLVTITSHYLKWGGL